MVYGIKKERTFQPNVYNTGILCYNVYKEGDEVKKIITLLLAVALMLSVFSGCFLLEPFNQHKILSELPDGQINTIPSQPKEEATEPPKEDILTVVPGVEYTLDQEMIDRFYDCLQISENVSIYGQDIQAAETAADELDTAYMALMDQYQIAYVLYCMDQSSETAKQRYMDCVELIADLDTAYNAMCKRVYLSGTSLRDELFADWTEKDIAMLLAYNDEIAQLEKRNSEITVEYRDLEKKDWEENMVKLYNELVENNNRIARIYGYDNYYDYAYDVVYKRDYGTEAIGQMRQYVAEYMHNITISAADRFNQTYKLMDADQQERFYNMNYSPYYVLDLNYVKIFVQEMPESSQQMMNDMFENERVVFTNSSNAFEGAFTALIGDEPLCFFGPGYNNIETVVHELGHYYSAKFSDFWNQPMDLAEVHSQGNEWMYIQTMREYLDPVLYEAIVDYRMTEDTSYILCFVMIDQFEEQVYKHPNAGNLTLEEYDQIMEDVAEDYGGIDRITATVLDIQSYWKYVVLEYPVHYISYAVSGICAINLFFEAEEDPAQAMEIYRRLMEEPLEGEGFLANIYAAGLEGPFSKTAYERIYGRYTN